MVIEISNEEVFNKNLETKDKVIVLKFHATWCGPCQTMKPIFEALSQELENKATFLSVNVDQGRYIAMKYNVSSIPTILFIYQGKVKETIIGSCDKEKIKKKVDEIYSNTK